MLSYNVVTSVCHHIRFGPSDGEWCDVTSKWRTVFVSRDQRVQGARGRE